jgi:6-phosphogluconolactonase
MEVVRLADPEAAATHAAHRIAELVRAAKEVRGEAHLALAGGTTPRSTYEQLGPLVGDWQGVHLWFGDERCVPPDDDQANVRMVRKSLHAPGAVEHRVPVELGPEEGAARYAAEFGETVLDVALLGLGPDGHTASLFPGHPALDSDGVAVGVRDAPKPPPERISLTLETLNAARAILLLTEGAEKREAIEHVLAGPDPATPASLLDRDKLELIGDEAALPPAGGR